MNNKKIDKISAAEIEQASLSGLANRPTGVTGFGGSGLSPGELKTRLVALARLGVDKVNELIDSLGDDQAGSALLSMLFTEVPSDVDDSVRMPLSRWLARAEERLKSYEDAPAAIEAVEDALNALENLQVQAVVAEREPGVELSREDEEKPVLTFRIPKGEPGQEGPQGPKGKDGVSTYCVDCDVVWDAKCAADKKWYWKVCSFPASGEKHVLADLDFRIVVGGVGFRYPVNLTYPYCDRTSSRMIFVKPRVMFEKEAQKTLVESFRIYEAPGEDGCRDLWVEICTNGTAVQEAYAKVLAKDDDTWPVYSTSYNSTQAASKPSGYDSLTVYSADWGNKNAVLSLDSRATAEGATVGGTGNRNDAQDSCVEGNGNTNTEKGKYSAVFGLGNTNKAPYSLISGTKNTNGETASNSVMLGHTQTNDGQHSFLHGYENHNDIINGSRFDYVDMHGTRLKAGRRCQFLRGQWNKVDNRAAAIWGNGTSETDRKNAFTVAASGTPEVDTDGITLGYLDTAAFKQKIVAALPIYNGEVESV